jgi:formate dehydrogenase accessory protein FdhD
MKKRSMRILRSPLSLTDSVLRTSGRIASEIIRKAGSARIPVIVSRSAPTNLSIMMAPEGGVPLIGFVRGNHLADFSKIKIEKNFLLDKFGKICEIQSKFSDEMLVGIKK